MSKNPHQPQTNDAVLGKQSSLTSLSQCPVCKTEYTKGDVNRCSVCNWDLTPCPQAFVEKHNVQLAWAREMWINLQAQEKQLHASQSQLEEVKQDKARFEGEVLHRLEQLEQAQDKSEPVMWAQMPQDTSKVDELEKQLSKIKEQLKGAERERQELKSEVDQLSAQVAKFEAELEKKRADEPQLISDAGIDYSRLQDFLIAGEWEKANMETGGIINTLLYEIANKCTDEEKAMDYFMENRSCAYSKWIILCIYEESEKDTRFYNVFHKLPGKDLHIIDRLWLKYSYGRFGFSVQKRLYELLQRDIIALSEALNWGTWDDKKTRYAPKDKQYSINSPVGHLPIVDVNDFHHEIYYLPSLLENIPSCLEFE
jgi:polyhydroxyalkanoate synthesis regulator phasin